jgi:hypothetical protein
MSIKNPDGLVKTFFNRRTDNQLVFLLNRLINNYQNDLFESLNVIDNWSETDVNMSRYFQSAASSFDFYEIVDHCIRIGKKEFERRGIKAEALL